MDWNKWFAYEAISLSITAIFYAVDPQHLILPRILSISMLTIFNTIICYSGQTK